MVEDSKDGLVTRLRSAHTPAIGRSLAAAMNGVRPRPSQIAARERSEKAVVSGRLSAAEVARMTFEAVRENRFYVITHPKMLASVELRMQDVGFTTPS